MHEINEITAYDIRNIIPDILYFCPHLFRIQDLNIVNLLLILYHKFSIGFASGRFAGHSRTGMLPSVRNETVKADQ